MRCRDSHSSNDQQFLNSSPFGKLESVQLDCALGDTLLREECGHLEPLISLKLDHLPEFVVIDESAVAGEFLVGR